MQVWHYADIEQATAMHDIYPGLWPWEAIVVYFQSYLPGPVIVVRMERCGANVS
jgi:hypothetical protein